MSNNSITTHILDLDSGRPAAQVAVTLYGPDSSGPLVQATTNSDGRIADWGKTIELVVGEYRLSFAVGSWYAQQERDSFYADIQIAFKVRRPDEHYHVPLLLNAYGYSTYRGS